MKSENTEALAEDAAVTKVTVVDRLKAQRDRASGDNSYILPKSGVVLTWPKFRPYSAWTRAQKIGGSDISKVQLAYIVGTCMFDGERLTLSDYADLIQASDHLTILGKVFSEDDAEAGAASEGN